PEPDSPTMPRVSPLATCTFTPSTALIQPRVLPGTRLVVIGKYFCNAMPCSNIVPSRANGCGHPAVCHVAGGHRHRGWIRCSTHGLALWAPGSKGATRRQVGEVRRLSADLHQGLLFQLDTRQTAQERLRVRMARSIEDLQCAARFDDFSGIHDG